MGTKIAPDRNNLNLMGENENYSQNKISCLKPNTPKSKTKYPFFPLILVILNQSHKLVNKRNDLLFSVIFIKSTFKKNTRKQLDFLVGKLNPSEDFKRNDPQIIPTRIELKTHINFNKTGKNFRYLFAKLL